VKENAYPVFLHHGGAWLPTRMGRDGSRSDLLKGTSYQVEKIGLSDLRALISYRTAVRHDLGVGGEKYPQLGARGGKENNAYVAKKWCRFAEMEGVNVGWAIIGVSANPWVHHLQI
jgi:hypothetical protein